MHLGVRIGVGLVTIVLAMCIVVGFIFIRKPSIENKNIVIVNTVAQASLPQAPVVATPIPQVISISPQDGDQEVMLDIEDPIVVHFDYSVKDFFVDFRLDPPASVTYENNAEKTEFKLLPKESLLLATPYVLKVFIKQRGMDDGTYKLLASSQFTTLKKELTPTQQIAVRKLSDVKRDTAAQISQGRYIDISLANQTMVLFEDGKPIDAYLVSSGKRGMETPKGQFKIENKAKRAWSKNYGLYMPHWMALVPSGKLGIHELPEWPSGYKEGANHLGVPVSHGCVRLGVGPAQRVWDFSEIGTPVIVH
jgi:lipoprotein-anchoring transpeptidase ErfK/SrfK